MAELTVEMTYGRALYEAATDCGKAELIREELKELVSLLKADPELFEFFCTPVISAEKKKAFILQVFEGKVSQELLNFLCVLADKRRGRSIPRIAAQYELLMNQQSGFALGQVYSVSLLSPEELAKVEEEAGKLLNKKLKLENLTDAGLVGGVKIFVEGKVIDASIKGRLLKMKESMVM